MPYREEVVGRNCRFLQGPMTNQDDVAKIREALSAEPPQAVTVTLVNYRRDGGAFYNCLHVAPIRDANGKVGFAHQPKEHTRFEHHRFSRCLSLNKLYILDMTYTDNQHCSRFVSMLVFKSTWVTPLFTWWGRALQRQSPPAPAISSSTRAVWLQCVWRCGRWQMVGCGARVIATANPGDCQPG